MSPLWHLKHVCKSTSGSISVLAAAIILIGASDFESPAWAGRDKPPVAKKDLVVTESGTEVKIKVLANDFDPDGTKVRLKRVGKPRKGKIRKTKGGTIKYTPDELAEGKDRFRYVIKDRNGKGKKAKGRVVVNILPESNPGGGEENDPPVADAGPNRSVTVGQTIILDGSDSSDPNGDPLTYSWSLVSWPTGSTADFSNSTKKKPVFVADTAGTFIAELVVYDGIIRSAADRVEIAASDAGPPPPPPAVSFDEYCDQPGVLFCEGFETDLSQANKNRCPNPSHPAHLCPLIQSDMAYEGSALQLTTDGSLGGDMTGIVSFPFPGVSTGWVYTHMRMRFGDGFNAYSAAGGFPGSKGDKFFILAGDGDTCNFVGGEMVVGDGKKRGFVSMSHSCGPGVRNEIPKNDFDIQPIDGIIGDCTYKNEKADDISGCAQQQDDVWHNFELAVFPAQSGQRARVKLWLDGVLVIDWESKPNPSSGFAWKGKGPYDEIYLTNYQTDHDRGADKGSGTYGDGLWRIWYDNLIISTECITTC